MTLHPIPPFYNGESEILILGSFPSVKSREQMFFYGHPQNRFWRVLAALFYREVPVSVEEKKALLAENKIALWDVIASCDIVGSSDSSIKNAVPNDIGVILANSRVERIFVNGRTAEKYYNKYLRPTVGRDAVCLPSTSPANAAKSIECLVREWSIITEHK